MLSTALLLTPASDGYKVPRKIHRRLFLIFETLATREVLSQELPGRLLREFAREGFEWVLKGGSREAKNNVPGAVGSLCGGR